MKATVFVALCFLSLLGGSGICPSYASAEAGEGAVKEPSISGLPIIPVYRYRILNTYPHDPNAFTQGLVFDSGVFYEGTGLRGHSTLRKVDLATGKVLKIRHLPKHLFGEGITVFGEKLVQLTWQSRLGFVYDKQSFEMLREFTYLTEGWGLTHDGERLIMSDGSSILHYLDAQTFEEVGQINVCEPPGKRIRLNELEYIRGEIFANVWPTDYIARISLETGKVLGWIDLKGLLNPQDRLRQVDVLNGIAYDDADHRLFVTGKLWPRVFEIELVPAEK